MTPTPNTFFTETHISKLSIREALFVILRTFHNRGKLSTNDPIQYADVDTSEDVINTREMSQ